MKEYEKKAIKLYNFVANAYHNLRTKRHPHGWFYNEMLEMPAMLELIGNIKGKKVLDMGCGTGIYTKLLTKKGARVKGFDISPAMLKIAKEENPEIDLRRGSAYNIPFHEKFEIVVAPLMIEYLEDWDKVLKQVSRVLGRGGYFLFSTGNPVANSREKVKYKGRKFRVFGDYFTERKIFGTWNNVGKEHGRKVKVFYFHKTYETVIKTIVRNGFELVDYKDTYPLKKAKKLFPQDYAMCSKIPYFAVWKVRKK